MPRYKGRSGADAKGEAMLFAEGGFLSDIASLIVAVGSLIGAILAFIKYLDERRMRKVAEGERKVAVDDLDLRDRADAGNANEDQESGSDQKSNKQAAKNTTHDAKYDENYWRDNYPGALKCALWYRDLLTRFCVIEETAYRKLMINLYIGGFVRVSVWWRSNNRAKIVVQRYEGDLTEAVNHLKSQGVPVTLQGNDLAFTVDPNQLNEKQAAHEWLAQRLAPQHRKK